jgi:hypothetical protein
MAELQVRVLAAPDDAACVNELEAYLALLTDLSAVLRKVPRVSTIRNLLDVVAPAIIGLAVCRRERELYIDFWQPIKKEDASR